MKAFLKKYFIGIILFSTVLFIAVNINEISYLNIGKQSATVLDILPTDAKQASGYAWNDNIGWINFGLTTTRTEGQVYVSNNKLYGYAWGENVGWISFNCENDDSCGTSNFAVTQNNSNGILTGYAWGENVGWIDFSPANGGVTITTNTAGTNTFSGYAWGENVGWISFSGTSPDYGVSTIWTKSSGGSVTTYGCDFQYSEWGECVNGEQTRTITPDPSDCSNSYEALASTQSCIATTTEPISISINSISTSTIFTGEQIQFTAQVSGTTTNNGVTWTIFPIDTDDFYGTISEAGLYTAPNHAVNITIIARAKADTTKTATKEITVKLIPPYAPINISLTPTNSTIFVNETIQFLANVTGTTTNNQINWIILPIDLDNFYGTISEGGLYIAPNHAVNITILAKARADTSKYAEANITVRLKTPEAFSVEITPNTLSAGEPITIKSIDWAPNTNVTISLHSDPVTLGVLKADGDGIINGSFDIPSETTIGSHLVKLDGTGKDGLARTLSFNITIVEAGALAAAKKEAELNGGGFGANGVPTILNISKLITENISILGTTTEEIYLGAKKIVESPAGSVVTKTITTVGVVGGGVAVTSVLAINGTAVADILLLPFRLWGLLLSALGLKKRNRPWGTIYDSVTKQPLDPAYVTLKKLHSKEENTSITDLDGRYGFLTSPGKYIITVNKTNYVFPSKKMHGKTEDILYSNLYFGEEIKIDKAGTIISKNIPLDPIKFDWNEFAKNKKKLMKFYSQREKMIKIMTDWIFRIGFVISIISLFLVAAPYNLIILGLYLLLTAFRKFGLKQRAIGALTEKNGDPLSFAVIRVFDSELKVEITNKVANKIGRYYCLVNNGKYYVKIEKKNNDESYTEILTSEVFKVENGIINKNFVI